MKSRTRLDSAVFQLTPTRTRYNLVINAKGKTEQISSGLLSPFLVHLKAAQDQIAKGCYSVKLEPDLVSEAVWFTKGTVERFVRFVNTPEVLERVNVIESEILQIQESVSIQNNDILGSNNVKHYKEKVDVYLRVLETRKVLLQKEQGMAFARAIAAGFDTDSMVHLISFAECFGAPRLMEACIGFMVLRKGKHENDQSLEIIEATEAMSGQSKLSSLNISNTRLNDTKEYNEFMEARCDSSSKFEGNGKASNAVSADTSFDLNRGIVGHQEFSQGMPYYHENHIGGAPFFQPPYPSMGDPRFNTTQTMGMNRHLMGLKDEHTKSETWETNVTCIKQQAASELVKQSSRVKKQRRKAGQSGRKQTSVDVVRNITYISSERRHNGMDGGSGSTSDPENDKIAEYVQDDGPKIKQKKSVDSKKFKEKQTRTIAIENSCDEDSEVFGHADRGNWQAFQSILLRNTNRDRHAIPEKEVQLKRQQKKTGADPIIHSYEVGDGRNFYDTIGGKRTLFLSARSDELMSSQGEVGRGSIKYSGDAHFRESEGGKGGYEKVVNNELFIYEQTARSDFLISKSDPLAGSTSLCNVPDESFILPLRKSSKDHAKSDIRASNDMYAEVPFGLQKKENVLSSLRKQLSYEPDDLSIMPLCGTVRESIGYDPAFDHDMQDCARGDLTVKNKNKVDSVSGVKKRSSKSAKDIKSRVMHENPVNRMMGAAVKNGTVKLTPSTEAQVRAAKIRSFKADLQKMKKMQEEEEIERLEALKRERQKRITAKSGSGHAQLRPQLKTKITQISYKGSKFSDPEPGSVPPVQGLASRTAPLESSASEKITKPSILNKDSPSQSTLPCQTRPQLQPKISPVSSKFSDSEPGPSSPLQRLRKRAASLGSNASPKITRPSGINSDGRSPSNKAIRSVSLSPDMKKANDVLTPDKKLSLDRVRRLSYPKVSNREHASPGEKVGAVGVRKFSEPEASNEHQVTSAKLHSPVSLTHSKVSDLSGFKKVSTTVSDGRSKVAVPPEMKNKPIKHPSDMVLKKTSKEELSLKTNHRSSVTTDATEIEHINLKTSHSSTGEDKGVIEDTVVLENEMPLIPVIRVSGEMIDTGRGSYNEHKVGVKTAMPVEYTSIQPPAATVAVKKVGGHIDEKPYSLQVAADCIMEERPECLSINAPTKPYPSSSARVLSFRGPCTKLIEDTRVLPSCSEMPAGNTEPAETHPSGLTHLNISKKTPGSIVKPLLKASSKGFKQLFKFGRNTVKHNVESERLNIKVSAVDNHVGSTASSNAGKKFERRGVKRATRPNPLYVA